MGGIGPSVEKAARQAFYEVYVVSENHVLCFGN